MSYSTLPQLGWLVPAVRPASTNPALATSAEDFSSVLCNGFGFVNADQKSCRDSVAPLGAGAVHLRYNCRDNTFWILTYVFSDIFMSNNTNMLFTVDKCGTTCGASDNKFVQYSGTAAGATCSKTCTAACLTTPDCWWCQNIWPIIDDGKWVGYLSQDHFTLAADSTLTSGTMMVHIDFGVTASDTTKTASSSNNVVPGTGVACFSCASKCFPMLAVS